MARFFCIMKHVESNSPSKPIVIPQKEKLLILSS